MVRKTVLGDHSGSTETSMVEFCRCSQHGQVYGIETGSAKTFGTICRKYAGPAPQIQLNARKAILNCTRWGISCQWGTHYKSQHDMDSTK